MTITPSSSSTSKPTLSPITHSTTTPTLVSPPRAPTAAAPHHHSTNSASSPPPKLSFRRSSHSTPTRSNTSILRTIFLPCTSSPSKSNHSRTRSESVTSRTSSETETENDDPLRLQSGGGGRSSFKRFDTNRTLESTDWIKRKFSISSPVKEKEKEKEKEVVATLAPTSPTSITTNPAWLQSPDGTAFGFGEELTRFGPPPSSPSKNKLRIGRKKVVEEEKGMKERGTFNVTGRGILWDISAVAVQKERRSAEEDRRELEEDRENGKVTLVWENVEDMKELRKRGTG